MVGQQPNISAGGTAKMNIPAGPRVGVLYAQLTVTKAAGGAGIYSTPVLSNIADPNRNIVVSIGGKDQLIRAPLELADDNALQSDKCYGSVSFYQDNALVSTVYDVRNTTQAPGIAANKATTTVFQLPIYFFQPWRKDLTIAESYALPTTFSNGTNLPVLQVSVPIAPPGMDLSGHEAFFWMSYDELPGTPVNDVPLNASTPGKAILDTDNAAPGARLLTWLKTHWPLVAGLALAVGFLIFQRKRTR